LDQVVPVQSVLLFIARIAKIGDIKRQIFCYFIYDNGHFKEILGPLVLFPAETHKTFGLVTDQGCLLFRAIAPAKKEIISLLSYVIGKPLGEPFGTRKIFV